MGVFERVPRGRKTLYHRRSRCPTMQNPESAHDPAFRDAESYREAFHLLATESVIPVDVRAMGRAGLDALAREHVEVASVFVGSDAQSTADVLASAVAHALRDDPRAGGPASPIWPAIAAMADSLDDPHTALLPAHAFEALGRVIVGGGNVVSPGFTLHKSGDRFIVSDVFALGPAEAADVRVGDTLLALTERPVRRGQLDLLRWFGVAEHTPLPISVERPGCAEPVLLDLDLVSHRLVNSVRRVLPSGIGYVRIRQMTMCDDPAVDARDLVVEALREFDGLGIAAMVLDLRSNSGGLGVSKLASLFTDSDPIIAYRYLDGRELEGQRKGPVWPRRRAVAILVNEQTTSAAEMVTLALADTRSAVVIGQPTAGALTLPRYVPMRDGQALSLSEALALGPISRRCPERRRVEPDRIVPNPTPDDLIAGRDPQLDAACAWLVEAAPR